MALQKGIPVLPVFIFDTSILNELPQDDKRVALIYNQISYLNQQLKKFGSGVLVRHGEPLSVFAQILDEFSVEAVYTNEDYEPYAIVRDSKINELLKRRGVEFHFFTDHVLLHPGKVKKADGTPYSVFTPWSKKWMQNIDLDSLKEYPSQDFLNSLFQIDTVIIDIQKLGFQKQQISIQTDLPDDDLLRAYADERNFPGNNGTSRLSVALRFGFISIRQLAINAGSFPVFLNELGWREFYMMIIVSFP
jgi:deoxyribodipyrimidine photo-lyase